MEEREIKVKASGVEKVFHFGALRRQVLKVLHDINMEVSRGEFVAFVGPSGCGKSTLLRILAGLERQTTGTVSIDGKPLERPIGSVGMVFQSYSSFPWLTVKENVEFAFRVSKQMIDREEKEKSVDQMLGLVGLRDFSDYYPSRLSGGMKQRVALARSLVLRPSLLLLDEPFGALDAQTRMLLQDQFKALWAKLDTTVCLVTHDIEEALFLADRIHVLTQRPATIRRIITNPFANNTNAQTRVDPGFLRLKMEIVDEMHDDAEEAMLSERQNRTGGIS